MPEEVANLTPKAFETTTYAERLNMGRTSVRRIGGWFVQPQGLTYYNGDAYIKIETSPYLRIIMNDGSNDRLLIGDDGT